VLPSTPHRIPAIGPMIVARQYLGEERSTLSERTTNYRFPLVHQHVEGVVVDFELGGFEVLQ
jgi:hypothetical protein